MPRRRPLNPRSPNGIHVKLWSWFLYAGQRAFSRSARNWWTGIGEVGFAVVLLLGGFVLLVASLTIAAMNPRPLAWREVISDFGLRVLVGATLVAIGFYRMFATLWKVNATAEQRGSIASQSGEIELVNELGGPEPEMPAIPLSSRGPIRGRRLRYEIHGSRRSILGLVLAGLASLVSIGLVSGMVIQAYQSFAGPRLDWFAVGTSALFLPVVGWTVVMLFRQFFLLAGFGPTRLEISDWPVYPGRKYRLSLFQPGRLRLKLLEVVLVCQEEATFSQGTTIRTEQKTVFEQRVFRSRGVEIGSGRPFEADLEMQLPAQAMHSFSSANNRVQWKIIVRGSARGWPDFHRTFLIAVHPVRVAQPQAV